MPKRLRVAPTDRWEQLEIHFTDPTQRTYELIRPVVLFGQSPRERAQETTTPERTLYRHLERFAAHGSPASIPNGPPLHRTRSHRGCDRVPSSQVGFPGARI